MDDQEFHMLQIIAEMFNWIVTYTLQYLEPFNFDLRWIELLEIELFVHLTVCI